MSVIDVLRMSNYQWPLTTCNLDSTVRHVGLWLQLILVGIVGSVFWVVNTETMAMYAGTQGMHPLWVGGLCSFGQNIVYIALYVGGDWLIKRWSWLRVKVEFLSEKLSASSSKTFLAVTAMAAVLGVPPIVGMVALAPAFRIPLLHVLAITLPCRAIRFSILAALGPVILEHLAPMLRWLGL